MLNFEDFLGKAPDFKQCLCGQMSTEVPCWDCLEARRKAALRASAEASPARIGEVPKSYADVDLSKPEILSRIGFKEPFQKIYQGAITSTKVIFSGPTGSGKTTLAVGLARKTGRRFWFVRAETICRERRRTSFGKISDAEKSLESRPFVILDDLGTESASETSWLIEPLFHRYENGLATWITTGMKWEQLVERYGEALVRRMMDRGLSVQLEKGKRR